MYFSPPVLLRRGGQ